MVTKTCTCNYVAQSTGSEYQQFMDLNNLKIKSGAYYTQSEIIKGKSKKPNRPAILLLTDFRFQLPTGAIVKNIEVVYTYYTVPINNEVCTLGKPLIVLKGVTSGYVKAKDKTQEGHAPDILDTEFHRNFSCEIPADIINTSGFGVQFRFPANTSNYSGYLRIRNIYLTLTYIVPDYGLTLNLASGKYADDTFEITSTLTNKNATYYVPWVTINLPIGFSYNSHTCKGELTVVSARVLKWVPKIYGVSSDTLRLKLDANISFGGNDSYTGTFDISEALNGTYKALNVTVLKDRPLTPIEQEDEDVNGVIDENTNETNIIQVKKGVDDPWFTTKVVLTEEQQDIYDDSYEEATIGIKVYDETNTQVYSDLGGHANNGQANVTVPYSLWELGRHTVKIVINTTTLETTEGSEVLRLVQHTYDLNNELIVDVLPADTVYPSATVMTLSDEELNRLGHGHTYTAETMLRISSTETYTRDWRKNCRIGIFNDAISENITNYTYLDDEGETQEITHDSTDYNNLTMEQILSHAIWSDMPNQLSQFQELTVNFRYNKDYPLYIIISNDYSDRNLQTVKFTEPCIIEDYTGRRDNGTYPKPILGTISNEESGEETIPGLTSADTLVFYDWDIEDDFISGEDNIAIRGIEVTGDIERADEIILSAKIINQGNESRNRSKVISDWQGDMDTEFTLGQYGDNWGLPTTSLQNFKDWEVQLTPSNTINDSNAIFNFKDVQLNIYIEEVESLPFKTYINGEDVTYYGGFIRNLKIPEGLETDTDFLTVSGTDTNKPFRQTIREKTIELEVDVDGNCDLNGNTTMLRDLMKLLMNERDKYNKPIPKRIEFSHYPDLYWDYIIKDSVTPDLEINGYTIKPKLIVPSGTAYSKDAIVTNNSGFVNGLAHINPVITLRPLGENIRITETVTSQTFQMGYTNYNGKFFEIDCENRRVYIKDNIEDNGIDISKYVDINSDWFRLLGDFNFETTNCIIHDVRFRERW